MVNHDFEIFDTFPVNGVKVITVFLSNYNKDYGDVNIGDTINNEFKITDKDKNKDIIFGYSKKSASYKVVEINGKD